MEGQLRLGTRLSLDTETIAPLCSAPPLTRPQSKLLRAGSFCDSLLLRKRPEFKSEINLPKKTPQFY